MLAVPDRKPALKHLGTLRYGIPAISFEVGDDTAREQIGTPGRIAAE